MLLLYSGLAQARPEFCHWWTEIHFLHRPGEKLTNYNMHNLPFLTLNCYIFSSHDARLICGTGHCMHQSSIEMEYLAHSVSYGVCAMG